MGFLHGQEAWRAAVYGVAKSQTWLSNWTELNGITLSDVSILRASFLVDNHSGKAKNSFTISDA